MPRRHPGSGAGVSAAVRAHDCVGCVLRADAGLVEVLTDTGRQVASLGGAMLARIATDPGARPAPGDWVRLTRWPDGPVTVDHALRRTPRDPGVDGVVVPLRPR